MNSSSTPPFATRFSSGHTKKVAIIGGGIVGVTTARALLQAGCVVHVFEQGSTVGLESSFAGAGLAAVGSAVTVSSPEVRSRFARQWFSNHAALHMPLKSSFRQWGFLARWLKHSGSKTHARDLGHLLSLAHFSQSLKSDFDAQMPMDHEYLQGSVQLFRTSKELDRALFYRGQRFEALNKLGVTHKVLSADECRQLEPGISADASLAGGIKFAGDSAANTALFTKQMKQYTASEGAIYHFETQVHQLLPEAGGWRVMTQSVAEKDKTSSSERFDAVVFATGADSLPLLAAQGVKLPLYPVRAYSLTLPIASLEDAPRCCVMDDNLQVNFTRLGLRLRVSGQSEIVGTKLRELVGKDAGKLPVSQARVKTLSYALQTWFPYASKLSEARYWCGVYPSLASGVPQIGASNIAGIFLNMGHGHNGWGLCFGAAQITADAVLGHASEIDTSGFSVVRANR